MGDDPAGLIEHEGMARLTHAYGRNDLPDELQVDLGDGHARRLAVAGHRHRHERFRPAVVADRAVPRVRGAGASHRGVGREVAPARRAVQVDARDEEPLASVGIDERDADDCWNLSQGPQRASRCCSSVPTSHACWTVRQADP